jgi:hypothetical protein
VQFEIWVNSSMRKSLGWNITPVFPDLVFDGQLELDSDMIYDIVDEVDKLPIVETNFGFITGENSTLDKTKKLIQVVGNVFHQKVFDYYKLNSAQIDVTCANSKFISVNPKHNFPLSAERLRWYSALVFLDIDESAKKGSSIYFEHFGDKRWSTPPMVSQSNIVKHGKPGKVLFWPSHIPWGLTPNLSNRRTLVFSCTYHIELKPEFQKG